MSAWEGCQKPSKTGRNPFFQRPPVAIWARWSLIIVLQLARGALPRGVKAALAVTFFCEWKTAISVMLRLDVVTDPI